MLWLSISAFFIGICTDWIWSKWLLAVSEKRPILAANWSMAVYICSIAATYLVISKEILPLLCYVLGGWFGTYIGIKYEGFNLFTWFKKWLK